MQIQLDFHASKLDAFRRFVEGKMKDGYEAEKVNYIGCATMLKKETHRISLCPNQKGCIIAIEYEVGSDTLIQEIRAHRNPDDFNEPRSIRQWKRLRSYDLSLVG